MKTFFLFFISILSISGVSAAESLESTVTSTIEFVTIGDPGNKGESSSRCIDMGSVKTCYQIAKYEVTADQYCHFLNAVASKGDPHHLYKQEMGSDPLISCITVSLSNDNASYIYSVIPGREKLPITYVNLYDAKRFCNWLENGSPTSEEEEVLEASTESGAYYFSQEGDQENTDFNPEAHYYIPSESEWVKAGYYKGKGSNAGYWAYPTRSDCAPNNGQGDVNDQANYRTMATLWSPRQTNPVLTPVNHFAHSYSSYGVYDMGGNVDEWTSSTNSFSQAIVRGGSWNSEYSIYYDNELMRTTYPKYYDPLTANHFIGFRIAKRVEAVSITNLLVNNNDLSKDMLIMPDMGSDSFYLWTVLRGLIFGCPRVMINEVLKCLGFNSIAVPSAFGLDIASARAIALMLTIDLVAYVAIMAALTACYYGISYLLSTSYK